MPGFLLSVASTVTCIHEGQAKPAEPNLRVTVSGQPTVTIGSPYAIAGCILPPPSAGNGPCLTAKFETAALRITSNGQPLLLLDSKATCVPTKTPLWITVTQERVSGE